MNKKRRWFFALLLALGMCLGMSVSVWAETLTEGDYDYEVNEDEDGNATNTVTITGYNGVGGDITIPSTLGDYTVTGIGKSVFGSIRLDVTSVIIPDSVTSIAEKAFYGCETLTSVTIPDNVTSIGECAFYRCSSLTSVTIPNGLTGIGANVFAYCSSLTSVTIPNSVTSIEAWAFLDCDGLESVSIPDSVTYIGKRAFLDCDGLESVSIPDSVTYIGENAFADCDGLKSVSISTDIAERAFNSCDSLESVSILNGATRIEESAFENCSNLKNVSVPDSMTYIGDEAFSKCSSLESVSIPDSVTYIGSRAFYYCESLTGVIEVPAGVTDIGWGAFWFCGSLTSIEVDTENSFYSSQDGVLFDKEQTTLIAYPGGKADSGYTIPDNVTTIRSYAFTSCKNLESIGISGNMTSIGAYAFAYCSSLTSVSIPASVTSIGEDAFENCNALVSATVYNYKADIGGHAFGWLSVYDAEADDVDYSRVDGFVLSGYSGSTAEIYATKYNITFQMLTCTHSYTSEVTAAATCTAAGTETYTCSICGDTYTKEISATGHSYNSGKVTTEATCTEAGVKTYTCETCKTTYTESIPATGHNYQNGVCTICGAKEKETETKDALAAPVISSVANSEKGVTVTWGAISGATQYRVYYKGGSVKNWTKVKDTADTSCTVTGLTSGKTYSFTVQCISPGESSYDATGTSIKYLSAGTISSLTNTAKGVKVKWTKVTGAKGYYVYRKLGSGSWKKVKTVKKNSTTSYTDTGVKSRNGKTCTYKVIPYSGSTKAAFVTSKTVRLTGVSISSLTNVKTKKLKVKWKKDSKVTGYEIQYSLKSGFSSAKTVKVKKKATTSASISRLTKGKKYYVRIRTYKSVSGAKYYSAWSGKKSVKIKK